MHGQKELLVMDKTKQVIVIRKDLNMRKGKMIVQGAHASLKAVLDKLDLTLTSNTITTINTISSIDPIFEWLNSGFTKIAVGVNSLEELKEIEQKAIANNITVAKITDLGRTEFKGIPTVTALAIGPDWIEKIDEITKHLQLL